MEPSENNEQYINSNNENIEKLKTHLKIIAPFLGAGASKPYGYPLWEEFLLDLSNDTSIASENSDKQKQEIDELIKNKEYMKATNKLEELLPDLSAFVRLHIRRIKEKVTAITDDNKGLLGEYLHLFPSKTYLTTNYDDVLEDILQIHFGKDITSVMTLNPYIMTGLKATQALTPTIYRLHGTYRDKDTIILSPSNYDDYYGLENPRNAKSNRRRLLAKIIRDLNDEYSFLFIGCGLNVSEDRILKLLREFMAYGSKPNYALLESDDLKDFERRETELLSINVYPIWYSKSKISHEEAKRELFEYLLKDERLIWNLQQQRKKEQKMQEINNEVQKLIDNFDFMKVKIKSFNIPKKYHSTNDNYQFALVKEDDKYYITDSGKTYEMLDKVFELNEPDVIKNLTAIMNECGVQQEGREYIIELSNYNVLTEETKEKTEEEAKYRLFTCVSFMDTMRIFYV